MRFLLIAVFLVFSVAGCRERYGLPLKAAKTGLLVVEGNILNGDTTKIRLTRTSPIDDRQLIPETGASVQIEGEDNSVYPLSESEPGSYKTAFLTLDKSVQYRLKIASGSGVYESDWLTVISTPPIDSITWKRDDRDSSVEISVSGKGTENDARFFKWEYDEVWEFHSAFESWLYYTYTLSPTGIKIYACVDTVIERAPITACVLPWYPPYGSLRNDSMYTCWKYQRSSNINIGSTAALSGNTILTPVRRIPTNAWEISVLYSILVKQTGLTREGYDFYKILKSNSEGLGTIFDAQPSQMKTNLKCVTNPDEIVLGFVDATTVSTKRLFIGNKELYDWKFRDSFPCAELEDVTYVNATDRGLVPTTVRKMNKFPPYDFYEYGITYPYCADCRLRGVHKKPDFWP